MADGIKIEIVSPERLLLSTRASSATIPGAEGYFTVLGEHAPVMTTLKPGFITVFIDGKADVFYVRSGFAKVNSDGVTVLAEQALPYGEFERSHVEDAIAAAHAAIAAAESDEHKSEAERVLMSLNNFIDEMTAYVPVGGTH